MNFGSKFSENYQQIFEESQRVEWQKLRWGHSALYTSI